MSYFQPTDMPDRRYFLFLEKGGGQRLVELTSSALLGQIPIIEKFVKGQTWERSLHHPMNFTQDYTAALPKVPNKKGRFRNTLMAPTKKVEQA
ncbi:MAG: hypothetical protein U0T81_00295 [Saprospiraceae bacterium]